MRPATALRAVCASLALVAAVAFAFPAAAQGGPDAGTTPAAGAAPQAPSEADANNPLAKFKAFNLHNYYVSEISDLDGQTANTFWLRYAQPFGKWLFRASLPLQRVPTGVASTKSGLGDLNAFAAYQLDVGAGVSFGVGPQLTMPTASEDETGTGKWQAGLSAILFDARSPAVQWGALVTWQTDFAGDGDRDGTNVLAVQPIFMVQAGKGVYFRSTGIMVFDLEKDAYNVPIGLGVGKVVPTKAAVFNLFIEPQYTVLSRGPGQPGLQVFIGINTQFVKK